MNMFKFCVEQFFIAAILLRVMLVHLAINKK